MDKKQLEDMDNSFNETDFRQYLLMLQEAINRMASNSSSCKNWTLTIVAALLALCASADELCNYIYISVLPVIMFWGLDFYYLLQEKKFRNHQKTFVSCYSKNNSWKDIIYSFDYKLTRPQEGDRIKTHCFKSYSLVLFYPIIIILIVLLSFFINSKGPQQVQDLQTPLEQMVIKQDSIMKAVKTLTDKYKPIQVESKSFHNSSFFQADNVDSVHVIVNKGIPSVE